VGDALARFRELWSLRDSIPDKERTALDAAIAEATEAAWAEVDTIENVAEREAAASELYVAPLRGGKRRTKKFEQMGRDHAGLPPRLRAVRERQEAERIVEMLYGEDERAARFGPQQHQPSARAGTS
jgi:hypothetical protein